MFADNLAYFYDTGPFGLATLCALGATTFAGHLDTVGENAFDAAATTTHTLRYQDSMLLSAGDIVTINAVNYKVIGVPRQINTAERLAHLVRHLLNGCRELGKDWAMRYQQWWVSFS